jgi:stress-induced morphogen
MAALFASPIAAVIGGKLAAASHKSRAVNRRSSAVAPLRAVGPDGEWISIRDTIQDKITAELAPEMLIVNDDSSKHANHKGMHDGHAGVRSNESHFSVVVVAEAFAVGLPRCMRMHHSRGGVGLVTRKWTGENEGGERDVNVAGLMIPSPLGRCSLARTALGFGIPQEISDRNNTSVTLRYSRSSLSFSLIAHTGGCLVKSSEPCFNLRK